MVSTETEIITQPFKKIPRLQQISPIEGCVIIYSHLLKQVLKKVKQMGKPASRLQTIWVDGGFDGEPFMRWVIDFCRWIVQVVLRPEQTKGFVLLKKRWVVERTLGWLMGCRRLARDYELLPETSETLIYLAMIRIMVRRLA